MPRIAIIYGSRHHGNTKKLVQEITQKLEIILIDAEQQTHRDLSAYDLIGFASGIDFGRFYDCVERFLRGNLPEKKRVFFLYTCAKTSDRFTGTVRKAAEEKEAVILGEYGCRGYNTYGPWKLIGGMNRNHPSDGEIEGAVSFLKSLL